MSIETLKASLAEATTWEAGRAVVDAHMVEFRSLPEASKNAYRKAWKARQEELAAAGEFKPGRAPE